jgi:hypothetical protein
MRKGTLDRSMQSDVLFVLHQRYDEIRQVFQPVKNTKAEHEKYDVLLIISVGVLACL